MRRALLAPLRGVAGAAQRLAAGDLHARVGEHGGIGEVGELASTFDQMAASLEDSRAALERQNRELAQQRTELIEAVRSAREGASIVRAVLDTTPDAIALLDEDGAVIVDNPPMRAVRAAFAAQATTLDPQPRARIGGEASRNGDGERRDEVALPGGRRTFARYAAPVHDGRGRPIGRLLVVRDITGEREAERAKQDFFALVSHELRTPLTAILGYVELRAERRRGAAVRRARAPPAGDRAQRAAARATRRRPAVRGAGRRCAAAAGAGRGRPRDARARRRRARPAAVRRTPASTLETELEPVERCIGDRDRLAQVLDNLLSNALKFTPPGGRVVVRLGQARRDRRGSRSPDSGVGIFAEDLPHLFDRFYRSRSATSRSVPGLGLGLTIVRTIVEGHGGSVSVRSEAGCGATFTVLLPAAGSDSRSREPSPADRRRTDPTPASGAGSPRRA